MSKPTIIWVDDDLTYVRWHSAVRHQIDTLTYSKIDFRLLAGAALASCKIEVEQLVDQVRNDGGVIVGIALDVNDQANHEPLAGLELLRQLRSTPGYHVGQMRIVLATIGAHVANVGENTEADAVISRASNISPKQAAEWLLNVFDCSQFIHKD